MPADAAHVANIIAAAQETWRPWAGISLVAYSVSDLTRTWSGRIADPQVVVRVREQDGKVRGVVSFGPETTSFEPSDMSGTSAHVTALFLDPALHGRGAAQALHDAALAAVRSFGYASARLWVPAGAVRARAFYRRNGWVLTGREVRFAGLLRLECRRPA